MLYLGTLDAAWAPAYLSSRLHMILVNMLHKPKAHESGEI